ncbi:MAG: hypothetical protein PHZ19_08660, partial [Candidatus Thermoplasmatota archaeon]|nr:hypothetical protein [Candidatus Thermoplasmatota archaeon]
GADSDIVKGLGMLWGTNHFHFNVEFTFKPGTPEPPAPPPVEPPPVDGVAYIRELLAQAVALIKEADARLAKWQS